MRFKLNKVLSSGKTIVIKEIVADQYLIRRIYTEYPKTFHCVEFLQDVKAHWFSRTTQECICSVIVEGQIIVERA